MVVPSITIKASASSMVIEEVDFAEDWLNNLNFNYSHYLILKIIF